jgi:hypothetical protein
MGGQRVARWLVDYKAPSVVDESDEVKFQYACQLHQGALICARLGIHLDGLMLSQFDWAGWRLKDDHVDYDAELSRLILRAGDHYWAYVLRGEAPDHVRRPRFQGEAELRSTWEERANLIARLNAKGKAVEEILRPLEQALREHLRSFRMAGTRCTVGDLSISAVAAVDLDAVKDALDEDGEQVLQSLARKGSSTSYDAELMARHLRSLGVSMKQFARVSLEEAKVYDWAVTNKLDPEAFIREDVRLSASDDLKSRARDSIREVFVLSAAVEPEDRNPTGGQGGREGQESTGRSAPRSVRA